ncbi:MAG: hypothetical protein GY856_26755 [bacterium]|nr:hypothetical protein [bacterium]
MKPGHDTAAEERWSRVTEIVDGALRRPDPKERSRYLRETCAGDGDLRREVEDLLRFENDDRRRRLLGDGHLHTALTEKDLASVYFDLGEDAVAEVLWSRAEGVLRAEKPPDAWELADVESRLGARLAARGRFEEAEVCLRESHQTLARLRGEQAFWTRQARKRLEAFSRRADWPQGDAARDTPSASNKR